MRIARFLSCALVLSTLLTGCEAAKPPTTSEVQAALPTDIAGPPEKVDVPYWTQLVDNIEWKEENGILTFFSTRPSWQGKTIMVYFVRAQNTEPYFENDFTIKSSAGLQLVAKGPIHQDGTFAVRWNTRGHSLPRRMYFIVKNDGKQCGTLEITRTPFNRS